MTFSLCFLSIVLTAGSEPPKARPFSIGGDISMLSEIEKHGGVFRRDGKPADFFTILNPSGGNGYRLRLSPGAEEAVRALPFVTWVGEIPPHHKITRDLATLAARPEASSRTRVILTAGESESRVAGLLAGHRARRRWRLVLPCPGPFVRG